MITPHLLALALVLPVAAAKAQGNTAAPSDLQVAVWAASCMACHGTDGKAEGTGLTIHGRSGDDLHRLLLDYKSGARRGTIMHQHAKGYTEHELERIARYFAQRRAAP